MTRPIAVVLSVAALGGCAHHPQVLEPAAGAPLAPGRETVAQTGAAGVTVEATGDSWSGDPRDLWRLFTPVWVTIENHSGRTLRVSHDDFSLSGASGFRHFAIPVAEARGVISAREAPPSLLRLAGWGSGPSYAEPQYMYPGYDTWPEPFADDLHPHLRFHGRWPERLPTRDMLSQALPEGAVEDGGKVSGFVYFQGVTRSESSVEFEVTLVDAADGQPFGRVAIPFGITRS